MQKERSGAGIGLASSVFQVKPSQIRELADVAFTMEGVIRLQFGESDMPTPEFIKEAASRAMAEGYTFYTENSGTAQSAGSPGRKVSRAPSGSAGPRLGDPGDGFRRPGPQPVDPVPLESRRRGADFDSQLAQRGPPS